MIISQLLFNSLKSEQIVNSGYLENKETLLQDTESKEKITYIGNKKIESIKPFYKVVY